MSGIQRNIAIPDHAVKFLFAEDFVNHFLLRFKLPLLSSGIANSRVFIYNAFTSEAKLAANYVYTLLEEEISEEVENILNENNNSIDINAFLDYIIPLTFTACVLPTELGVRNLLNFCVKASAMAAKSYTYGYLDAPGLAVDYIKNILCNVDRIEDFWVVLKIVATKYAQKFAEMDNSYLTPDNSASDYSDSLSTLSSEISEASSSPDHEMEEVNPEELSDGDYCNLCIADLRSSEEEPVPSTSDCRHVEKSNDVKDNDIASFSRCVSDSGSTGSSKHNHSSTSFHSFDGTSSEDDGSKDKIRKMLYKKRSCWHSKESDSESDKCETDAKKTTQRIDAFDKLLTVEKRSAILSSSANDPFASDSEDQFKTPNSDSLASDEDFNESSMEEGDRIQSSRAKSSPSRKPVLKRRK